MSLIGQGLALARGLKTRHAVKQVDRLLSNPGIDVDALLPHWVRHVVGQRPAITVAMDWTEFAADGQATLMLSLLCRHGRATPLFWLSVETATLKDRRNGYEYQALVRVSGGQDPRKSGGGVWVVRLLRPGRGESTVVLAAIQDAARRAEGAVACGHPGQPLCAPASGKAAGTEG